MPSEESRERLAAGAPDVEAVFRTNLEAFGERARRVCLLASAGRLSPDSCFLALTQLWIQLAHAHRELADRVGGESAPDDGPGAGFG